MQLPRPGEILEGKYRLEEMLGEGAFGLVVKATTISTNRPVAVKILKPSKDGYKDSRAQRFMRELRVIAKLQCPNTLTLYDFGRTEDGVLYMVTEFVEGEDLYDLLDRRGHLSEKEVMHILHQCLLSLSEAHEHGVLHRDIKPHNIRLSQYGDDPLRVKVLDFGLSKTMEEEAGSTLTAAGIAVGTPRYMSPEQLSGKELGPKSDIYSLGLVAYEMLIGEPASPLDSVVGPRRRVSIDESADVSPHLRELINWMLKRSRRERYATAAEVLAALKLVRAGQPPSPPNPAGGYRTPAPRSGRFDAASGGSYDSLPRLGTGETLPLSERQKQKEESASGAVNIPLVALIMTAVVVIGLVVAYFVDRKMVTDEEQAVPIGRRAVPTWTAPDEPPAENAPSTDNGNKTKTAEQAVARPVGALDCSGLEAFDRGVHNISSIAALSRESVDVYIPDDYDPTKKHPTIWFFHDSTTKPVDVLNRINAHKELDDLPSFVVVAAETRPLTVWYYPKEFDIALESLELARERLCIDPDRFYVWGHGFGGRIATRWGACSDDVAAVASTNYRERFPQKLCDPPRKIPYLHVAATNDPVAPADGSPGCYDEWIQLGCQGCIVDLPSIAEHEELFKERHGCRGEQRSAVGVSAAKSCHTWKCDTPFMSCLADGARPLPQVRNPVRDPCARGAAANFPYIRTVYEFFSQFERKKAEE